MSRSIACRPDSGVTLYRDMRGKAVTSLERPDLRGRSSPLMWRQWLQVTCGATALVSPVDPSTRPYLYQRTMPRC